MHQDLITANEAFYRAIRDGDYPTMDTLWASRRAVTCTHPGWTRLAGRASVMDSWRMILTEQEPPEIWPSDVTAIATGQSGFVICTETLGGIQLIASNAFVREGEAWRLINHQAAQLPLAQAR